MSESSESKCQWVGGLPGYQQTGFCGGCQRQCSAADVLKCQMGGGPKPPEEAQETPHKKFTHVVNPAKPVATPRVKRPSSQLGDCLKAKFDVYGVTQKPGCSCKDIQKTLNSSTVEEVERSLMVYVDNIFENVQNLSGIMGNLIKVYSWVSPDSAKTRIRELLQECLEAAKQKALSDAPECPTEPLDGQDGSEPIPEPPSP